MCQYNNERLGRLRAEIVVLQPDRRTPYVEWLKTAIIIHKIEEKRSFSTL